MPPAPPDQGSPKPDDAVSASLDTWLCFADLRRAGIVSSWKTLREWQLDKRIGFPMGRLFAKNTRRWSKQHEIDPWLKNRPVEPDEQMRTQRFNSASKAAETRRKHREQSPARETTP
jgi:hypothetical protein